MQCNSHISPHQTTAQVLHICKNQGQESRGIEMYPKITPISSVASGGQSAPMTAKICQKLGKIWEYSGKRRKKLGKEGKRGKLGKVLSLCPSWQRELATLLTPIPFWHGRMVNVHVIIPFPSPSTFSQRI